MLRSKSACYILLSVVRIYPSSEQGCGWHGRHGVGSVELPYNPGSGGVPSSHLPLRSDCGHLSLGPSLMRRCVGNDNHRYKTASGGCFKGST